MTDTAGNVSVQRDSIANVFADFYEGLYGLRVGDDYSDLPGNSERHCEPIDACEPWAQLCPIIYRSVYHIEKNK